MSGMMVFLIAAEKRNRSRRKNQTKTETRASNRSSDYDKKINKSETDCIICEMSASNSEVTQFFKKLFEYGVASMDEYREWKNKDIRIAYEQALSHLKRQEELIRKLGIEFTGSRHFQDNNEFDMPETYLTIPFYIYPFYEEEVNDSLKLIERKDKNYLEYIQRTKKELTKRPERKARKKMLQNELERLNDILNKMPKFRKKERLEITENIKRIKKEIKDINRKLDFNFNAYKEAVSYLSLTLEQKKAIIEYSKAIVETRETLIRLSFLKRYIPTKQSDITHDFVGSEVFWQKALSKMIREENITPEYVDDIFKKIDASIQEYENATPYSGHTHYIVIDFGVDVTYREMLDWFFKNVYYYERKQELPDEYKEENNYEEDNYNIDDSNKEEINLSKERNCDNMVPNELDSDGQILIRKQAGAKKDAIRITKEEDIPEELKGAIKIVDGQLELDCTEGVEHAPLGSVIGYEKSPNTKSGINTWHIANASTNLIEEDGVFYTKATILPAQKLSEELPEFMEGAPVVRNEDGSWTVITDWGQSTGFPGEAYFVRYGTKKDGTPDVNILTKTEPSYEAYYVCDEKGNIIGQLSELDPVVKGKTR